MPLFDPIRLGSSAAGDYEIERSLRFNSSDSTNMHREGGSEGNRRTFTVSVWIKRASRGEHSWWDFYTNDSNRTIFQLYFGYLRLFSRVGGSTQCSLNTDSSMELRDFSAWYHFIYAVDTTQSSSSNRVKMYINGEQQTVSGSFPGQNAEMFVGSTNENRIGCQHDSAGNEAFFNGYMAEFNYIDGQQLTPSDFAETDTVTGQYNPIEYSGSYGTRGYYLNFSNNSSTSNLGTDFSGNGNNFTSVNGFSVSSGVGNDSVTDTPTNNWCTMSPNIRTGGNSPTYTNGNLSVQGPGSGIGKCGATCGLSSGKWYVEAKITHSGSNLMLGIINAETNYNNNEYLGSGSDYAIAADCLNKRIRKEGSNNQTSLGGMQNGDILAFAVDMDNGTFQLYNNGSTKGSSVSFTVANYSPMTFAQTTGASSSKVEWNFGQQGFTYTPPTGFKAPNSQNLPEPTAPDGSKYMDILEWAGNGSNRSITGLEFSPDWVWVKKYAGGSDRSHQVFDIVRGAQQTLHADNTDSDHTNGNRLSSFDSNGFSIGTSGGDDGINPSNGHMVAWCWDAGSSTVTNNNGSISCQTRALTTAGFSIVSYTGNGSSGATVGHGLGVVPTMFVVKRRDQGNRGWNVYHHKIGNTKYIQWQQSGAENTNSAWWNNTTPSSTTFTLGNDNDVNQNSGTYIAYVFTDILGYSKFGIYTGSGNSDGAFVFTGFRPRYVVVKRSDSGNHWVIYDSKLSTFNVVDDYLRIDTNNAQSTDSQVNIDFYANGFKLRSPYDIVNAGSGRYIYMAFAENAFKYARAR
jgi:hypothetical protein